MNLIEESFQKKEVNKRKKLTTIIIVAIVFVLLIIIAISIYLIYLKSTQLKISLNGQGNEEIGSLLVFDTDGTLYVPIKEIAKYFEYESFNGEYSEKSEDPSKCYVQNANEIANFTLGENKIYKLDLTDSNNNYEYVYIEKPVKAINGVLYTTTEGIEKAFNVSFDYDQATNNIQILTMPYLIQGYANVILNYGYTEISDVFANQKTVLQDMLVVKKEGNTGSYGVIDIEGNAILEPKYDNITYLPDTGDFLVENNGKVGILSKTKETKVQIAYDSIELMDSDAGLYIAQRDNKYGVIDLNGNIKIYIENDEIGVDISRFTQNNIKNKYILADKLIPAKKDNLWGLYDTNGNLVVDYKYDQLGYIATNNRNAQNLLVIPEYNVIVAGKDKKYTLVNSSGQEVILPIADDIYMTTSGGEKHYYINANDKQYDAEEYLDRTGVTTDKKEENEEEQNTNNTNITNSEQNTNNTNTTNSEQNTDNANIANDEQNT